MVIKNVPDAYRKEVSKIKNERLKKTSNSNSL